MKKVYAFCILTVSLFRRAKTLSGYPKYSISTIIFFREVHKHTISGRTDGRMYFANNEGLITYDGSYWKLYPQPNETILSSIALDNNRIYAGGQDEIGYYSPTNMEF